MAIASVSASLLNSWSASESKELQELNLCLPHYLHSCVSASFPACITHWGKDLLMQKLVGREVLVLLLVN